MSWQATTGRGEIIGQDAVVEQFVRAAAHGRIAGSYLFIGPAGVGKSRLIDELLDTLDEIGAGSGAVLEGVCAPYGESNVWSPIASAIAGSAAEAATCSCQRSRKRRASASGSSFSLMAGPRAGLRALRPTGFASIMPE
jgi:hypothetical protein